MTLEQLRIFLAVADGQHMTHAATKLGLSQSAVSAAISALETRHDVRLFDRIGRRVSLTENGRIFLREARSLLSHAESASLVLDDLSSKLRGRLRVHASQTIASYWLPTRLVALHDLYPEIAVMMTVGNTASVAEAVHEGRADLGLVEGDITQGNLRRQVIARDRLVLVMASGHPLASEHSVPPEAFADWGWVLREQGSGTRSEFEGLLTKSGVKLSDLTIALELPSNEAVLAAVAAGRFLSVLSERAVAAMATADWVRTFPLAHAERSFAVLMHPDRHMTRAKQMLLGLLPEGEGTVPIPAIR
ncbi:LysR family transcriptional regulator [Oryzicola mucosus]|uniref:LysR family transcriptional regulator n=1 Tax=Oryzicola mucosus TaxID=2767425 RepID=A0A8J6PN33_9HYPH|nr:LysR family transcriptional regulator [Oryzicola mucosus]MBD0417393.1 LysR family transcriptional regulator [Oryzicola mucosus]